MQVHKTVQSRLVATFIACDGFKHIQLLGSIIGLSSAGVSIAVQRGEKLMKSEPSISDKIVEIGIIERQQATSLVTPCCV